ncbi:hypothetical protein QJQ45_006534 [Haematococcus lacustris]|nr:hypothetical protein QJQ45_006534 [Haematococcus lacustris]
MGSGDPGLLVIGAGFGRTGTLSTKAALETLLGGKCYHMASAAASQPAAAAAAGDGNGDDVALFPAASKVWAESWCWVLQADSILNRQHKVWATAFTNWPAGRSTALATLSTYKSGIDLPIQMVYKQLMAEFPDAKVLLTVRATIWKVDLLLRGAPAYVAALCPDVKYWIAMHDAYFAPSGLFQGRIHDKEHMRQVFEGWNAEVQRVVPPDRLLVFNVKQGWAPLCAFLGVPVPDDKSFPNVNDSAEFQQVLVKIRRALTLLSWGIPAAGVALLASVVYAARMLLQVQWRAALG